MLNVVMLNVVMLSVVILNVVILNVVAPDSNLLSKDYELNGIPLCYQSTVDV
jgi:hypothetical protein